MQPGAKQFIAMQCLVRCEWLSYSLERAQVARKRGLRDLYAHLGEAIAQLVLAVDGLLPEQPLDQAMTV